jgi:BTB/POZ domain
LIFLRKLKQPIFRNVLKILLKLQSVPHSTQPDPRCILNSRLNHFINQTMTDPRSTDSCDITFLVGPQKQVVQGNKFVLGYNSPVFHRMFFTDFPSENEIIVPDVDAEAFETMINGISGQEVDLNAENVASVYKVAEKYDLRLLRQMCKTFVVNSVDLTNALAYLNMFHHYNESEINEKCLSIILDEPLQFFKQPDFLGASADVVHSIFTQSSINCSFGDMKTALSAWMTNNGLNFSDPQWYEAIETHLSITRNQLETKKMRQNLFRKIEYSLTDKNSLTNYF